MEETVSVAIAVLAFFFAICMICMLLKAAVKCIKLVLAVAIPIAAGYMFGLEAAQGTIMIFAAYAVGKRARRIGRKIISIAEKKYRSGIFGR